MADGEEYLGDNHVMTNFCHYLHMGTVQHFALCWIKNVDEGLPLSHVADSITFLKLAKSFTLILSVL